jgi:hypothetical protein
VLSPRPSSFSALHVRHTLKENRTYVYEIPFASTPLWAAAKSVQRLRCFGERSLRPCIKWLDTLQECQAYCRSIVTSSITSAVDTSFLIPTSIDSVHASTHNHHDDFQHHFLSFSSFLCNRIFSSNTRECYHQADQGCPWSFDNLQGDSHLRDQG